MSTPPPAPRSAAALKSWAAHDHGIPPAAPAQPVGRSPEGPGNDAPRHCAGPALVTAGDSGVDVASGLAVVAMAPVVAGPPDVRIE